MYVLLVQLKTKLQFEILQFLAALYNLGVCVVL